jgi:hypothetical protein
MLNFPDRGSRGWQWFAYLMTSEKSVLPSERQIEQIICPVGTFSSSVVISSWKCDFWETIHDPTLCGCQSHRRRGEKRKWN